MDLLQSTILGITQGITEFIPVSSSGHLIILPELFFWKTHPLAFDTTLHLGTALALIIYFFKDLWNIGTSFLNDVWEKEDNFREYSKKGKLGLYILVGSIPAGLIGFFLEDLIKDHLRTSLMVVIFLIFGSFLMFFAELFSKNIKKKKIRKLGLGNAFVIGLFQSLALMPGVSRSGATISGGMFFGLKRDEAARFSFLLSVPIVIFAGAHELYTYIRYSDAHISFVYMLVGFISSFVMGMFAISFLMKFLKTNKLYPFIVYRLVLAFLILGLVL